MTAEQIKEAIENNSNYWERRALENKLNIIENEEDYVKRISALYDKASRDIDDKLAAIYTRYAKENKLTLDEAYQMLPKKMETQYKRDVMDYIEKAKSGDGKWKQYLLNQSIMHKHSVLDQLRTEMRNAVYNIDMETTGGKFLEKIFMNSNYYAQYTDGQEAFAKVDQDKIKRLLEEDWSGGGNFSSSIWKNKEQLINALDDIVIRGLATGESYEDMADRLAKRMETSKSNARRLIMTESARMDNEGLLAHYKETDVKKLVFVATLDMRTSDICKAMDGEIIPIEEAKIGLNVPPMHPYCRSVISPYYEFNEVNDRVYRDKDTGKTESGDYKDYVDYLKRHLGDQKQAEALASKKNTLKNLLLATAPNAAASLSSMDPTIKEITGHDINEEHFEYVKSRNDRDSEYYVKSGNTTYEEIDEMFKDLKKAIEDEANDVAINVKADALEKILESNKILNGFETDNIRNMVERHRRRAEMDLFNIPEDAAASLRPVYGFLSNNEILNGIPGARLGMYGDITITLKKSVKSKCTITIGDSLDMSCSVFPSRLNNLKSYSCLYYDLEDFQNMGLGGLHVYPEVQIFKKLDLDDIQRITIPKEYKTSKLEKLLEKNEIEVEWK